MEGVEEILTASSLFPNPPSLLDGNPHPGTGNCDVTPSRLSPHSFPFTLSFLLKLLTADQSCQACLCGEYHLPGKEEDRAEMIALSCLRSSHYVPAPVFNQGSFSVSFQLYCPQNYPIFIKSYYPNIVQVSVSLVVFQLPFTSAPLAICILAIILCPFFSLVLLTAIPEPVQLPQCHTLCVAA